MSHFAIGTRQHEVQDLVRANCFIKENFDKEKILI